MWIVLSVVFFLVGQLYLFRCLRKLDRFLDTEHGEKPVLSVVLTAPQLERQMSGLLEHYSLGHPDVDLVIHIDPEAMDALRQRKADVCLCPESDVRGGLNCLTLSLSDGSQQQVIWRNEEKVHDFVRYLWQTCGK